MDPEACTLEAFRLEGARYVLLVTHVGLARVRAEPFEVETIFKVRGESIAVAAIAGASWRWRGVEPQASIRAPRRRCPRCQEHGTAHLRIRQRPLADGGLLPEDERRAGALDRPAPACDVRATRMEPASNHP